MITRDGIREALFDADGSVRDITFTPVEARRVAAFVEDLSASFMLQSGSDSEGADIRDAISSGSVAGLFGSDSGSIHTVWTSKTHVIASLQVFVSWPESAESLFIELTFFPNDLVRELFDVDRFLAMVDSWSSVLGAESYFVRYENASWKEFDRDAPDVIYTRNTKPGEQAGADQHATAPESKAE